MKFDPWAIEIVPGDPILVVGRLWFLCLARFSSSNIPCRFCVTSPPQRRGRPKTDIRTCGASRNMMLALPQVCSADKTNHYTCCDCDFVLAVEEPLALNGQRSHAISVLSYTPWINTSTSATVPWTQSIGEHAYCLTVLIDFAPLFLWV